MLKINNYAITLNRLKNRILGKSILGIKVFRNLNLVNMAYIVSAQDKSKNSVWN